MAKEANGPNSTILGAAGEHFVMSQLLRRNMIAALAPTGVPNADIVVTDKLGDRLCAVHVKVRRDIGSDGGWHMGQKHEELVSPNLFYSFVDFGKSLADQPRTWVVPSGTVAKSLRKFIRIGCTRLERRGSSAMTAPFDASCPTTIPSQYKLGWLNPYFENWASLARRNGAGGPNRVGARRRLCE
jgi:hypothetical protein